MTRRLSADARSDRAFSFRARSRLNGPLVQLALAGGVLLVVARVLSPDQGPRAEAPQIVVSDADVRAIVASWKLQGRPAPSALELASLVQARVREEILYREAVALGLDRKDEIVRQRLAQMMEYLLDDVARLDGPDDGEVEAWFARNRTRFAEPARATFRQIHFSSDRRGSRARADAAAALATLPGARDPRDDADGAPLGDPSLIEGVHEDRLLPDVAAQLGAEFSAALPGLPHGVWSGPVESAYGWHLVRVDALTPERIPSFAEIEPEVRAAWDQERRVKLRADAYDAIRARYEVVLPAGRDDDAPSRASEVSR